ncbi:MAG: hypothetical protein AMS15_06100 [Planctomycetes bacterium DG_23]|nr:MAG: hypothetical protein AMS15_06100 [Planctomycetes bacterium DG_23]
MAKEDEPFSLEVALRSFRSGPAVLRLYRNRQYMGGKEIELKEGLTRFEIRERLQESGFYEYEVLVEALGDGSFSNNRGYAFTEVRGEPRILLLEGKPQEAQSLTRALEGGGFNVHLEGPAGLPASLGEFQNYDSIVLSNISALTMTDAQMEMIRVFVRDLGGGLAMIGGEESFGLGGYYRTPVEEALPVDMDVRRKKNLPSLALVLCIDKSGSMADYAPGARKVSLAKEAAILTLELLADWDEIGVIAFDAAPKWVVRLQKCENRGAIISDIRTIRAGGGTAIYPALAEAYKALKDTQAILKHTIVMTDGMSLPGDFEGIAARMNEEVITLSAVGIGPDAHTDFLQNLARMGGGRFYWGSDVSFIPRIFTKDALIASRALLVEEEFQPRILRWAEMVKGIDWERAPSLLGYVDTSPKKRAEVIMTTHTDDPLLARFRYGLGKSLAFTSDAKGRWAKHWLNWPGFRPFWAQTLRWLLRSRAPGNLSTTVRLDSGKGKVVVDAVTPEGEFQNFLELSVRVVKPDFSAETLPLTQVAPGRYEAEFAALSSGTYMTNITGPESQLLDSAGASLGYPPEYKDVEPNTYLLERLASITGGSVISDLTGIFEHKKERPSAYLEIWMPLVISALILLFLDIITRRLVMPEALLKLREKRVRQTVVERSTQVMTRLKRRKEALGLKERPVAEAPSPTPTETKEILEKIPKAAVSEEKKEEPAEGKEEPSAPRTYTGRLLEAKRKARKERRL